MPDETTSTPDAPAAEAAERPPLTGKAARTRSRWIRWAVLFGVLAFSTVIGLLHQYPDLLGFRTPPVDALCPFGGIESLWRVLAEGGYLKRIAASSFILLAGTLTVSALFGRAFCGQFCPLGAIQEFFARIGIRIAGRRLTMPAVIDRPARYLKYVVLAVFTFWTWQAAELVMRPYDPWAAYHHLTSAELLTDFAIGAAILGIAVVGSIGFDRFFCKYLCPMGAFLALVNKLSFYKVRRTAPTCTDCKACDTACPVNIEVSTADSVTSAECLACGECVNVCPVSSTLEFSTRSRSSVLSATGVTLATFVVMAALIVATTASGAFGWTWGAKGQGAGNNAGATGTTDACEEEAAGTAEDVVPLEGAFDTSAIKGSMTLIDVSELTGIPTDVILADLGIESEALDVTLKDLGATYDGLTPSVVRDYVTWRLGGGGEVGAGGDACGEEGAEGG